jgi:hypothetical protein
MKIIIVFTAVFLANITLSQTKKNIPIHKCDTTKKNVSVDLKVNGGTISFSFSKNKNNATNVAMGIELDENKYTLSLYLPTQKPDVTIKGSTIFRITMADDSTLLYFTKGTAVAEFSTYTKQYEHFLMLEGNYNDAQWNHLARTRIKSITNLTGNDYLIDPEESKKLLEEIKCYATNLKK